MSDLTNFQTSFSAAFGTVWTRQPMKSMRDLPWDSTETGMVAMAFNGYADSKAYPVVLVNVPDAIQKTSQVDAIKLDTGAKCKVFVGQLKLAGDVADAMEHDASIAPEVHLSFEAGDLMRIINLAEEATHENREKRATKKAEVPKAEKVDDDPFAAPESAPVHEAPVTEDEIPFGAPVPVTEDDPFAISGDSAEALVVDEAPDGPAPEVVEEAKTRKPRAKKDKPVEPTPESVPDSAPEPDAKASKDQKLSAKINDKTRNVLTYVEEILENALRQVNDAKLATDDQNPLTILESAAKLIDIAALKVAQSRLRGAIEEDYTINPLIAITASNISLEARAFLRDLDIAPERVAVWDAFVKGNKKLIDRASNIAGTLHEDGIQDHVKHTNPALRTSDGERLIDTKE